MEMLYFSLAGAARCRVCINGVKDEALCKGVAQCQGLEVCYKDVYVEPDGTFTYYKGCRAKEVCLLNQAFVSKRDTSFVSRLYTGYGVRRSVRPGQNICTACCDEEFCTDDHCQIGDPGTTGSLSTVTCYSCASVDKPDECSKLTTCSETQICYTSHRYAGGGRTTFRLGCEDKTICELHDKMAALIQSDGQPQPYLHLPTNLNLRLRSDSNHHNNHHHNHRHRREGIDDDNILCLTCCPYDYCNRLEDCFQGKRAPNVTLPSGASSNTAMAATTNTPVSTNSPSQHTTSAPTTATTATTTTATTTTTAAIPIATSPQSSNILSLTVNLTTTTSSIPAPSTHTPPQQPSKSTTTILPSSTPPQQPQQTTTTSLPLPSSTSLLPQQTTTTILPSLTPILSQQTTTTTILPALSSPLTHQSTTMLPLPYSPSQLSQESTTTTLPSSTPILPQKSTPVLISSRPQQPHHSITTMLPLPYSSELSQESTSSSMLPAPSSPLPQQSTTTIPTLLPATPTATQAVNTPIQGVLCYECSGAFCGFFDTTTTQCPSGTPYCLTSLIKVHGQKLKITKSCVDIPTCRTKWYDSSSDRGLCLNSGQIQQVADLACYYCCTSDNCNAGVIPDDSTLYNPTS